MSRFAQELGNQVKRRPMELHFDEGQLSQMYLPLNREFEHIVHDTWRCDAVHELEDKQILRVRLDEQWFEGAEPLVHEDAVLVDEGGEFVEAFEALQQDSQLLIINPAIFQHDLLQFEIGRAMESLN